MVYEVNSKQDYLVERDKGCFYYKRNQELKIISQEILDTLISKLERRELKLGRICIHDGDNDIIQAMLIALNSEFVVERHFHEAPEIIQVLRGTLEINTYDLENKKNKILLQKDDNFIFRISNNIIHSVKSVDGWCLFLEIASGPFTNKKTIYV